MPLDNVQRLPAKGKTTAPGDKLCTACALSKVHGPCAVTVLGLASAGVYRQSRQQQADAGDDLTRELAARQARPPRVQRLRHGRARARGLRLAQRCRAESIYRL